MNKAPRYRTHQYRLAFVIRLYYAFKWNHILMIPSVGEMTPSPINTMQSTKKDEDTPPVSTEVSSVNALEDIALETVMSGSDSSTHSSQSNVHRNKEIDGSAGTIGSEISMKRSNSSLDSRASNDAKLKRNEQDEMIPDTKPAPQSSLMPQVESKLNNKSGDLCLVRKGSLSETPVESVSNKCSFHDAKILLKIKPNYNLAYLCPTST